MHRMILRGPTSESICTAFYSYLRAAQPRAGKKPRASTKAQRLEKQARAEMERLRRSEAPAVEPPRSPELVAVIEKLLGEVLAPAPRTDEQLAELAVILYLGYELGCEVPQPPPHPEVTDEGS